MLTTGSEFNRGEAGLTFWRRRNERRGAILALVAVSTVGFLALVALVIDVGHMQRERRRMQTAVDAGALAGAFEISRDQALSPTKALVEGSVRREAKRNGFEDGVSGTIIPSDSIVYPATGATYNGNAFVTVTIERSVPTTFAQVLGKQFVTVKTRATAGVVRAEFCFIVLNEGGSGSKPPLWVGSSATLTGSGCGIQVNSTNSPAATITNSATVSAPFLGVSGATIANSGTVTPSTKLITNTPKMRDPLLSITPPTVPNTCDYGSETGGLPISGTITLKPGTYCGGIISKGGANITFRPGIYYLRGGGMDLSGSNPTATGLGVTFYNTAPPAATKTKDYTWGPFYLQSGGSSMDLHANTDPSNPLAGILFMSDPAAPYMVNVFKANSTTILDGTVYFPTGMASFQSNSTFTFNGALIAYDVELLSGAQVTFTGYGGGVQFYPLKRPTIVE